MTKKYGKIKGPKTPEEVKKSKRRKRIILGAGAVVILGGALIVPKLMKSGDMKPVVSVAKVQEEDITSILDTSGTVTSLNTKTYFSPVNANIKEYKAKVGQVVNKGDLLVSFNTDSLEKDNQKAELSASATINSNNDTLEKTNKTLNEAAVSRQNVDIIENDIRNFKAYINDLNTAIQNRTQELSNEAVETMTSAAASQSEELSALNQALVPAAERETMLASNIQLQAEIDDLHIQKSQAEFGGDTVTANILGRQISAKEKTMESNEEKIKKCERSLGEYADMSSEEIQNRITALSSMGDTSGGTDVSTDAQIAQWQLDLQDAQSTLAELQGDLAEEEAKVSAGEAAELTSAGREAMENNNNLAELEAANVEELLQKGRKGIYAEFNGIITKAELSSGTAASQGLELVSVSSNREVAVEATVSKYDYGKLKVGQKASVEIGDYEYQGTVNAISKVAQVNEKGSPIISCEVKIDNPDDNIFLGVEAKVAITTAKVNGVLSVPLAAVNTGKDGSFCYVVRDGVVVRQDIVTGISSADSMEVLQGLNKGEQVIEDLPQGVEEGMSVDTMEGNSSMTAGMSGAES